MHSIPRFLFYHFMSLLTEDVDILDALMRLTAIFNNKHFIFVRILNNLLFMTNFSLFATENDHIALDNSH